MIKHIVMWRLKDADDPAKQRAHATAAKRSLEALAGQIEGLLAIEVGIDFSRDAHSADLVLLSEFTDRSALAGYQAHPAHLAVAREIREIAIERRVVDYER
jgi:hypothetical protein